VAQDFTNDRERLLGIIQTMIVGDAEGFDATTADASSADTGAAFGQDDSEFNIFNTDRQLSALQTAAKMLGHLNEKKALLYFASGLRLNGMDNQAQLHATVNAAIRAGVSFWPIDARGLVASAPLGDATQGIAGWAPACTRANPRWLFHRTSRSRRTRCGPWPADTGGKALLDNNDLAAGIVQAQKSVSSYYIIGYYTTNEALTASSAHQDCAQQRTVGEPGLSARAITPARCSRSSRPPTRNGSWKTR
jgi:VWFA-related protein